MREEYSYTNVHHCPHYQRLFHSAEWNGTMESDYAKGVVRQYCTIITV